MALYQCDTIRTAWTNSGTKAGLLCLYYDTSNISSLSVLVNSERIFRNDITLPTYLYPNYSYL